MPSIADPAASHPPPEAGAPTSANVLTLPANVISTLSPETFLNAHLSSHPPVRPSGRAPAEFRPIAVSTSSLSNCLGSAVVRTGNTSVVCGITPELLYVSEIADPPPSRPRRKHGPADRKRRKQDTADMAHLHLLVPNIDLNTGSSSSNQPGQAPTNYAMTMSQRLCQMLLVSDLLNIEDLRVTRPKAQGSREGSPAGNPADAMTGVKGPDTALQGMEDEDEDSEDAEETIAYYTLHINLTVLSLDGHNSLLDAAWAATLAALRDLRLPRSYWDEDREVVLCSDLMDEAHGLSLRGTPVACTWGVFAGGLHNGTGNGPTQKSWLLADVDELEECVCDEFVTIVVDCTQNQLRLLRLEKSGGGLVDAVKLGELVAQAGSRWKQVMAALPKAMT